MSETRPYHGLDGYRLDASGRLEIRDGVGSWSADEAAAYLAGYVASRGGDAFLAGDSQEARQAHWEVHDPGFRVALEDFDADCDSVREVFEALARAAA